MAALGKYLVEHLKSRAETILVQGCKGDEERAWIASLLAKAVQDAFWPTWEIYDFDGLSPVLQRLLVLPGDPHSSTKLALAAPPATPPAPTLPTSCRTAKSFEVEVDSDGEDANAGIRVGGLPVSNLADAPSKPSKLRGASHPDPVVQGGGDLGSRQADAMLVLLRSLLQLGLPMIVCLRNLTSHHFRDPQVATLFMKCRELGVIFWCFSSLFSLKIPVEMLRGSFSHVFCLGLQGIRSVRGLEAWKKDFLVSAYHLNYFEANIGSFRSLVLEKTEIDVHGVCDHYNMFCFAPGRPFAQFCCVQKPQIKVFRAATGPAAPAPARPPPRELTENDYLNEDPTPSVDCRQQ